MFGSRAGWPSGPATHNRTVPHNRVAESILKHNGVTLTKQPQYQSKVHISKSLLKSQISGQLISLMDISKVVRHSKQLSNTHSKYSSLIQQVDAHGHFHKQSNKWLPEIVDSITRQYRLTQANTLNTGKERTNFKRLQITNTNVLDNVPTRARSDCGHHCARSDRGHH